MKTETTKRDAVDALFCPPLLAGWSARCLIYLAKEKDKLMPDGTLIALLWDGVRIAREYNANMNRQVSMQDDIKTLRAQIEELRRQVGFKDEVLARKNRELDALHYVWCDGGCDGGVHRWQDAPITEEIVADAERNTRRLRAWWMNHLSRKEREHPNQEM